MSELTAEGWVGLQTNVIQSSADEMRACGIVNNDNRQS